MSIKLLDFEEVCIVKPPHSCNTSCGDLCATYAEIVMTGRKIGELNDAMTEQLNHYRGLKTKMNMLRDPIAKRLPVELATAIFGLCLPKQCSQLQRNDTIYRGEDNASALFTLGAVCKTWREVIWSTPRLWSHIRIPLGPSNIQLTTSFVKEWLSRTGQVSLSVAIYYTRFPWMSGHDDFEWTEEAMPLSKIVNATSSRWEYLDFKLPPILAQMFEGNPSNLRELRILNAGRHEEQLRPGSFTLNDGPKPMPTYVEVEFACLKAIDIAWDNVTDFKSETMHIQDCLELLRLAPKLTQCEFLSMRSDTDMAYVLAGIHRVVHNNLRDLIFNYPDPDDQLIPPHFFDQLVLPHLETLTVKLDGDLLPAENIMSLIGRSSCLLQSLSVDAELEEDALISLLRVVPSIWYLRLSLPIHGGFSTKKLFETFAQTTRIFDNEAAGLTDPTAFVNQNFLPELQVLEYSTGNPEDCERIWDMIPNVLGNPDILDSDEEDEISTRPLDTLVISFLRPHIGHRARYPNYISKPTLLRIQALRDLQCEIDINILTSTGGIDKDFIEMSLANVENNGEIAVSTTDSQ